MNSPSVTVRNIFLIAVVIFVAAGCRKPSSDSAAAKSAYHPEKDPLINPPSLFEPPGEKEAADRNQTLYILLDGNPGTLNPLFVSSLNDFTVVDALYAQPFTIDRDMNWMLNDDIAESFEESDDHTIYTVRLRPGLAWHDGMPFTAQDIVYSWSRILDPDVPCLTQKPSTEPITECVAVDEVTVRFVQPAPVAASKWNLLFPIIPKHIFEQDRAGHPDLRSGPFYGRQERSPIGNGPYRLIEWKDNDRIVIERWEDYQCHKPYFKRIVFRIVPDRSMALLCFEKGDIDVIDRLSARQFALDTNTKAFARIGSRVWNTRPTYSYIGWNMNGSNPFFTDRLVRLAMTSALNVRLVLENVYYNLAAVCVGIYHPDSWMYNPSVKAVEYDLKRAAELLEQAGWKIKSSDGWRYKQIDGVEVRFEFTLLMPDGSPGAGGIAAIFGEDLKRLGVLMKTRSLERTAFIDFVSRGRFEAVLSSWDAGPDPDFGRSTWRRQDSDNGRNYVGYSNPAVDELFELGRGEFDFKARQRIYQEIQKLIYQDQPYTWICFEPALSVFNRRIRGVGAGPRGVMNFHPGFCSWWTAAGQAE